MILLASITHFSANHFTDGQDIFLFVVSDNFFGYFLKDFISHSQNLKFNNRENKSLTEEESC